MFVAVWSLLVVVAGLSFSYRGRTADRTGDSEIYSHNHLQNPDKDKSSKEEVTPCSRSAQYSCLRNGSLPCPPWSYCDSVHGTCKCPRIPTRALECDGFEKRNSPRVLECNCMTYNEELNQTEVGHCIYNCAIYKKTSPFDVVYHSFPTNTSDWNDVMCGKFRTGTLCGRCNEEDGFYPRAYSFDVTCIKCTNGKSNWWKYVLSVYLHLTLFYLIILCFKINIHTSRIYHV